MLSTKIVQPLDSSSRLPPGGTFEANRAQLLSEQVTIQEILESMLEQCDEIRSQSTQSADAVNVYYENRFKGKLVKVHKEKSIKQIVYDRLGFTAAITCSTCAQRTRRWSRDLWVKQDGRDFELCGEIKSDCFIKIKFTHR